MRFTKNSPEKKSHILVWFAILRARRRRLLAEILKKRPTGNKGFNLETEYQID